MRGVVWGVLRYVNYLVECEFLVHDSLNSFFLQGSRYTFLIGQAGTYASHYYDADWLL